MRRQEKFSDPEAEQLPQRLFVSRIVSRLYALPNRADLFLANIVISHPASRLYHAVIARLKTFFGALTNRFLPSMRTSAPFSLT